MEHSIDRIVGCIVGGAIGDACGLPFEGTALLPGADVVQLNGWYISDDTQLTLATCEAIVRNNGRVDPAVIAAEFARWYTQRRISGAGASTHKALSELAAGGHWALVGRKGEYAAGNGAAMRIAPLAFCVEPEKEDARQSIRDVSRITHHSEEAYAGALAVATAVRMAWNGIWHSQNGMLALVAEQLPDSLVRDRITAIAQLEAGNSVRAIAQRYGCSGYVVESIPLALCGAWQMAHHGFESGLRDLISAGGDTDTIASISGQIAGAFLGNSGLPGYLFAQLHEAEAIYRVAREFAESLCRLPQQE